MIPSRLLSLAPERLLGFAERLSTLGAMSLWSWRRTAENKLHEKFFHSVDFDLQSSSVRYGWYAGRFYLCG